MTEAEAKEVCSVIEDVNAQVLIIQSNCGRMILELAALRRQVWSTVPKEPRP